MRRHVIAQSSHPARVVSHPLQCQPKRRAADIQDGRIGRDGKATCQVVKRIRSTPIHPKQLRWQDGVKALKPVEQIIILAREIKERRRNREGDHNGIDALGAHREPANGCRKDHRQQQGQWDYDPPRPPLRNVGDCTVAKNCDHIASKPCKCHLRHAHHATITTQEHQA